tara:strand:- start:3208 stop:5064 length:1857 start_codon:yes stop_codon:yes gene_type:complete
MHRFSFMALLAFIMLNASSIDPLVAQTVNCNAHFSKMPDSSLTAHFWRTGNSSYYNARLEYAWDFGDGSTAYYRTKPWRVTHTYATPGWYEVSRIVYAIDPAGDTVCTDQYSNHFPVGFLVGNNCMISIQSNDTINTNNYTVNSNLQSFSTSQATYQIEKMRVGGVFGRMMSTDWGPPSTSHPAGTGGYGSVYFGNGSMEACASRQFMEVGTDSIIAECIDCKNIVVQAPFTLNLVDQTQVSSQGSVSLSAVGTAFPSNLPQGTVERFRWNFRNGLSFTGNNQNVYLPRTGTYYYELTYTLADTITGDFIGATVIRDSITITPNNSCRADFSFYQSQNPLDVNFTNLSSNGFSENTFSQFHWEFGDGATDSSASPRHIFGQNGSYRVKLTHSVYDSTQQNLLCVDTVSKLLSINSNTPPTQCVAHFAVDSASSGNYNLVIVNNSIPAHNDSDYSISYKWYFGDGDSSMIAFPTHTYQQTKAYNLCLQVNATHTATGTTCSAIFCDTIGVDSLGNIIFKAGQGFSINVVQPQSISVNEIDIASQWSIYPNPAHDVLHFSGVDFSLGQLELRVFDLQGQTVKSDTIKDSESLSLSGLKSGLYLILLKQGEALTQKKILIE